MSTTRKIIAGLGLAAAVLIPAGAASAYSFPHANPTPPSTPRATVPTVVIPPGTPTGVIVPGSGAANFLTTVANQFGITSTMYALTLSSTQVECSAPVETKPGNTSVWAYCALPG